MDKLVAFFKNAWFRRGVALVCCGYTGILIWTAWLSFAYYFEFENATSLFVLYLFVNFAALGLMILTRKQVITMINAMILPPIVFAIVIFGFGNWYMILPPLVVVTVMFFVNASNETLKTVLGTLYLLIYVIGVVAYIAINLFMGKITFTGVDLSLRDTSYEKVSPSGDYRIVRYVDKPGERRTASYYVESTEEDIEIPFATCKRVYGSKHIHTASYTGKSNDPVGWEITIVDGESVESLNVEGSIRTNPLTIIETDEDDEEETVEDYIRELVSQKDAETSEQSAEGTAELSETVSAR
jgi:hypothetical protein